MNIMKHYMLIIDDLISQEIVRRMMYYNQHGRMNTLLHCMNVSYTSYKICQCLNIDPYDVVRAAILHDFYLYDWHKAKSIWQHALLHSSKVVRNIEKYHLPLNKKQKKMILSHMFPLAPIPSSLGGWILTLADKYCTCIEVFDFSGKIYSRFREVLYHEDCI